MAARSPFRHHHGDNQMTLMVHHDDDDDDGSIVGRGAASTTAIITECAERGCIHSTEVVWGWWQDTFADSFVPPNY